MGISSRTLPDGADGGKGSRSHAPDHSTYEGAWSKVQESVPGLDSFYKQVQIPIGGWAANKGFLEPLTPVKTLPLLRGELSRANGIKLGKTRTDSGQNLQLEIGENPPPNRSRPCSAGGSRWAWTQARIETKNDDDGGGGGGAGSGERRPSGRVVC
jgi:hypothetical protein